MNRSINLPRRTNLTDVIFMFQFHQVHVTKAENNFDIRKSRTAEFDMNENEFGGTT